MMHFLWMKVTFIQPDDFGAHSVHIKYCFQESKENIDDIFDKCMSNMHIKIDLQGID